MGYDCRAAATRASSYELELPGRAPLAVLAAAMSDWTPIGVARVPFQQRALRADPAPAQRGYTALPCVTPVAPAADRRGLSFNRREGGAARYVGILHC